MWWDFRAAARPRTDVRVALACGQLARGRAVAAIAKLEVARHRVRDGEGGEKAVKTVPRPAVCPQGVPMGVPVGRWSTLALYGLHCVFSGCVLRGHCASQNTLMALGLCVWCVCVLRFNPFTHAMYSSTWTHPWTSAAINPQTSPLARMIANPI